MREVKEEGASDTLSYLLSDHLGSLSEVVTGASVSASQRYSALGETRDAQGSPPTGFQFTGQYNEEDLGIYYFGARWFDPRLGRWLQPDFIVPNQYDPISWDRYAYGLNNPLNYIDPDGHCPLLISMGVGAAIGGMVGAISYFGSNMSSFDSGEYWTAVGAGAVTGALIGSGVGILALPEVAAAGGATIAVANTLIGAGSGAAGAGLGYTLTSPNGFESDDFLAMTAVGGTVGGVTANIGGGLAGAVLKEVTYIAGSEAQYALTTDQWSAQGAKGAVISGAISGAFDVIPGMALGGMKPPLVEIGIGRTANVALKQEFARQLAGYQVVASLNGVATGVASTFTAAGVNYIRGKLEAR